MKLVTAAAFFWIVAIIGITLKHWSAAFVCVALALSLAVLLQSGTIKFVLSLGTPVIVIILFVGYFFYGTNSAPVNPDRLEQQSWETTLVLRFLGIASIIGFGFYKLSTYLDEKTHMTPEEEARLYGLPTEFKITKVGSSYVEFQHPEGGSWAYGITQDLSCVHGIEEVESLGDWNYRIHVNRNPVNAARVLEAAYRFRTEPKVVEDGVVVLYKCPGYEILFQESERNLD